MNVLTRKLENFAALSDDDKRLLEEATARSSEVAPRTDILEEGAAPENVHLITEGLACRYKIIPDGGRQIVAYLVPGDFCDLHVFILKQMDHSIATLSRCRVVDIPPGRILELTERPAIARALWWATLVDEAILREWLVGLGRRQAAERIAHLFCELLLRLRVVGLANSDSFELPITQQELGDTTGLSSVHVNRSLQSLREEGLIAIRRNHVVIEDPERLQQFSGFNPNYLHLANAGKRAGCRCDRRSSR